ncbi:PAS domain S-box-containing protein [Trichlorobacter thiogenes]|uniref:PAS domain S-box-containing protein n=1 Tax=Trichlorobacter thiogenes TaxID=115783 RepID=A0A1T4N0R4_9BACT|nr:sigma 54-interacting transcriptional regulator [Trichlorobacter thiogenes]SJZ72714.1 PAS domain S-box-containing protein [Trichlorobacter thiogenes]
MSKSPRHTPVTAPATTDAILESISDGVFTVDPEWRITSFNRAAEEITGISRRDAIGRLCSEVFRSNMCETDCALRKTLKSGKPVIGRSGYIIDEEGNRIPISLSTAVLKDNSGKVVGGAETFRDLSEVETLRHELEGRFHMGDIVSRSPLMQRLFEVIPTIAVSPSTVLLNGETGTGKELMARTIHSLSKQSKGPFIALNCGALPDTLLESELFGYKVGAFTGATKDKPGRFALAKGGTLFLDEIGEISPALQVRLLRVLQEHCFEPLGGTHSVTTDARIIVATNRDLAELTRNGTFREDLYYRVNVVRIELPPLRRRKEDIPLLVEQFIIKFNHLHHATVRCMAPEALSLLMAHDWPGNVRELENVIERAFVLCPDGTIEIPHLPDELTLHGSRSAGPVSLQDARSQMEAQAIQTSLEQNGFNRLATAKALGMHKTTLFRKIRQLGIVLPGQDGRSRR